MLKKSILFFYFFLLFPALCWSERGKNVSFTPGWQSVKKAAFRAVTDPETWIPAAGALFVQIDDLDDRISDWVSDNNPIFGSEDRAKSISDYLRGASAAAYVVTELLSPHEGGISNFLKDKGKGFLIGGIALLIDWQITQGLKDVSERDRPDYEDDESFPSGHAATSSLLSTLATKNLEYMSLSDNTKKLLHIGFSSLAFATAYARLEGRKHYPSDVLMGYAIGHFLGVFFDELFFSKAAPSDLSFYTIPGGFFIGFHKNW